MARARGLMAPKGQTFQRVSPGIYRGSDGQVIRSAQNPSRGAPPMPQGQFQGQARPQMQARPQAPMPQNQLPPRINNQPLNLQGQQMGQQGNPQASFQQMGQIQGDLGQGTFSQNYNPAQGINFPQGSSRLPSQGQLPQGGWGSMGRGPLNFQSFGFPSGGVNEEVFRPSQVENPQFIDRRNFPQQQISSYPFMKR